MAALDLVFDADQTGFLLANAVAVLLGTLLLVRDPRGRASRVFGVYLLARGLGDFAQAFNEMSVDGAAAFSWHAASHVAIVAQAFLLAGFISVYPHPRGPIGKNRGVAYAWYGLALVACLVVTIWPGLVVERTVTAQGLRTGAAGPLFVLPYLTVLMESVVAVMLLRDHTLARPGAQRRVLWLLAVGFSTVAAFQGAIWLGILPFFLDGLRTPYMAYDLALLTLLLVGMIIILERMASALYRGRASQGAAIAGLVAVAAAALAGWAAGYDLRLYNALFGPVWMVLPILAAIGLLRYSLFDIDLRIRWTIKQSTLAGIFVAVFFIISEGAQQFIGDARGNEYLGIAGAGGLLFVLAPLQRFADRLATRAVPDAKPVTEMGAAERLSLYRDQVELAWQDGMIGVKERMILRNLRDRLGIDLQKADQIEEEVTVGAATLRVRRTAAA